MRTVAEHLAACLEIAQAAAPLDVVLPDAVGCVLAQDVVSGIDLPAVDLAGQDGYAVIAKDVAEADRHNPLVLDVVDAVRAGDMRPCHLVSGAAVLIDSGAPMPLGADAVIPWADTDRGESRVTIHRSVAAGDNVRRRAEDVKSGTTVLTRGSVRFDAVAMSPGRQLGVGTVEGTPIFCLPGDPVSAQIAFETFVRPVLRQIAGRTSLHRSSLPATISEGWHSPSGKREFVPVHVSGSPSRGYRAEPTTPPGTVRLHGLSEANAIAVVPEDTSTVVAGDTLHCLLLDA